MAQTPARNAARLIVRPFQEFLALETAGAMLLLAAAATALLWANLPGESYVEFWHRHIDVDLGFVELNLTREEWVSDGLMAVFFYVVGLEIKRELLRGELADRRRAALPAAAALGGMVAPALVYLSFNIGTDGEDGWGIPMATDIAFSVGLLSLLGPRVPLSFKVFMLALAIVDDLGAIAVIAIFYTDEVDLQWLGLAVAMFALTAVFGRFGVRAAVAYIVVALVAWLAVYESGVHATIAGVILGLLTPIEPRYDPMVLRASANDLVEQFARGRSDPSPEGRDLADASLRELEELARESRAPLDRLEHGLHPWTTFLIIPLFALANAGIELGGSAIEDSATSRVGLGVALGLIIGKPLGITVACFVAVRAGMAALPPDTRWSHVLALGMVAGIGFTVSLFIAALAFEDQPALLAEAKMAVLAGSAIIGVAGLIALRSLLPEGSGAKGDS